MNKTRPVAPSNGGIYLIRHTASGKQYIGSSSNFRRRWAEHKSHLNRGIHGNPKLQAAWSKYGESAFTFSVVEEVADISKLTEREQIWIDAAKPTYNIQILAGRGHAGMKRGPLSEEHKAKLSAARKGRPLADWHREFLANINKNRTPEHRANISKARKGVKSSEETKAKLSIAQKGRTHSEETKAKQSAAHMGRPKSESHKQALRKPKSPEHCAALSVARKAWWDAKKAAMAEAMLIPQAS